jgi:hypothetical protein
VSEVAGPLVTVRGRRQRRPGPSLAASTGTPPDGDLQTSHAAPSRQSRHWGCGHRRLSDRGGQEDRTRTHLTSTALTTAGTSSHRSRLQRRLLSVSPVDLSLGHVLPSRSLQDLGQSPGLNRLNLCSKVTEPDPCRICCRKAEGIGHPDQGRGTGSGARSRGQRTWPLRLRLGQDHSHEVTPSYRCLHGYTVETVSRPCELP